MEISLPVEQNGVIYFEWRPGEIRSDRGYSYVRTTQYPAINPITRLDYPDPDAIRVGDTYYMVSTTMHFMPGCEILRSYDLRNWEHLSYVYDKLDSTPGQTLEGEENIYGKGMWAASLRYHNGTYYVCFVANDTHKTYLYTASQPEGPWEKHYIEGFFHDCSLLFDDDGKVYIVYGNKEIWLTQLKEDLSAPLEGGLHRLIVNDKDNTHLGYEGSHLYKINGKYYLFLIHSRPDVWRRTEACFVADSLEGEFTGGDVLDDDLGLPNRGVAQGPIIDTPDGKWYAIQFQDSGAVGRVPYLMPVTWKDDYPVFGEDGKIPEDFPIESTRPGYIYAPLVGSEDFKAELKTHWEFNHEPDLSLICHDKEAGTWQVRTDKVCTSLLQARNTLTQRMLMPGCAAEVTIDGSGLKEGDFAGLCSLQSCYGFVGLTRRNGELLMVVRTVEPGEFRKFPPENKPEEEWAAVPVEEKPFVLKLEADFSRGKDVCSFYYKDKSFWSRWQKIGPEHQLRFSMEHFCGCRFGLTVYSTKEPGGSAVFSEFVYRER
ncbi:MAG: glycosyl hydrolase 43 family protein [Lachnospiraceae bacterium]|nr:glycosyl hydrolase 43 family protein [Lachnospiraceae bacterium]